MVGQGALFACFVHLEAVGLIARGLRRFRVWRLLAAHARGSSTLNDQLTKQQQSTLFALSTLDKNKTRTYKESRHKETLT
jgi:hypothetical protein